MQGKMIRKRTKEKSTKTKAPKKMPNQCQNKKPETKKQKQKSTNRRARFVPPKCQVRSLFDFNLTLGWSFDDFLFLWESDSQDSVDHHSRDFFAFNFLRKYKTSAV